MDEDARIKLGELGSDIENLNAPIKELEGKKNRSAFMALTQSTKAKEAREKGLINDLYGYGEQKHGIVNKGLTAEKARFEAEKNDPYVRLQNLQQVLDTIGGESEEILSHPDLAPMNAQQLVKALQAYGIDTNKPVNQWESSSRTNMPVYQGKLVEPINPTMDRSYKLAEELSPFYKDKNYLDRKLTRKDVINTPNSINQVVEGLPQSLNPKFEALDYEGQKKLEADLNALNAKYIRQGTYGSGAHLKSVSNRMRELNDATLTSRGNYVKNDLLKNITSKHREDINKIGKLGQYDQLANTEFGNTLGEIKNTNLKGLEKWKNDQENNEQLYKSYQNEKSFQQPMLLNNARGTGYASGVEGGINTVFNHFNNQGIDLSSISDLQGRYSELEKELASRNDAIKSAEDYKTRQEELARQNMTEFEREKTQRLSLERERGELNERLLREIEGRKTLEQDLAKKQELERQYQNMLNKGEEAKQLKLEEDRRLKEIARTEQLRAEQEYAEKSRKNRINQLQEQERIKQSEIFRKQIQREQHEKNELLRLRQEKLNWYNSFENNMRAVPENATIYAKSGSPGFENAIARVWGMNFPYSPNNYIDDPNLRNIMPVRRYGQDIVPAYSFQAKPFTG